jgi:hypothetical protein
MRRFMGTPVAFGREEGDFHYSLTQRRPPQQAQQRRSLGTPLESLGFLISSR